jgi:hypothetical protein
MKHQMTLVDVAPVEAWAGSKALVPLEAGVCPACGCATERLTFGEPQMFRHGGYGATRETVVEVCSAPVVVCRWSLVRSVTEVRP